MNAWSSPFNVKMLPRYAKTSMDPTNVYAVKDCTGLTINAKVSLSINREKMP